MSNDVVNKIEKNLSSLDSLLGKDNVEEMKKQICDLIVDRVKSDIDSYDCYLFYPDDYSESINEAFEKIHKKIVKMYSDAALEAAQEAVDRFKDMSASALTDTPGLVQKHCHKCKHHEFNKCKFYQDYYWKVYGKLCAAEGFINYEEEK